MDVYLAADRLQRHVDAVYQKHIEAQGLGFRPVELLVLNTLYERDGQHASELACAVNRAATSFTPTLDSLVEWGVVERAPDAADRRAVRLYLTDVGKTYVDSVTQAVRDAEAELREDLLDYLPLEADGLATPA